MRMALNARITFESLTPKLWAAQHLAAQSVPSMVAGA